MTPISTQNTNITLAPDVDVPYCDAYPDAKAGWLDTLKQDMKAPDALGYYPPPAHLMRPVSPPGQSEQTGEPSTSSRVDKPEKDIGDSRE